MPHQTIRFTQPDALNDPFEMKRFREKHIEEATPELWAAPATATHVLMGQLMNHPTELPLDAATDALHTLIRSSLEHVKKMQGVGPTAEWTRNILSAQGQAFATPLGIRGHHTYFYSLFVGKSGGEGELELKDRYGVP